MSEEVQLYMDDAKDKMNKALVHLESELLKIRAGKASPAMLAGVMVDYYGSRVPITQVANVNTQDARTLVIQPWEKKLIDALEKAVFAANLGLTPVNNGEVIRISIPPLTEERRQGLVKQVKHEGENAKVSIRNARREAIEEIKKLQKQGIPEDEIKKAEEDMQKTTDHFSKKVEEVLQKKEAEIMVV
ncbi:MAG TPA: ribosome recycling factor [Bacteroidales bacterium]|nr:ribosome recycling factor [Bacteroidales bacterium]